MKYRTVELLASGDQSEGSGTKIIDIKVRDIISRIMIYWQVTMAGEGMDDYQYKDISKIELVNGSDVLFGMDGGECQALNIYDRKCATMNYKQKLGSNSLASNYGIDFGRFLHDPLLALDPKMFDNLQLKITFNEALADTGATANELGVKAEVFDEKVVTPIGFLSAREIYEALSPSSGYTYVRLPRDRTLRKLLIRGYYKGQEPWQTVANARLSEDQDKRIPFDWNIERYYRMMLAEWTPVVEEIVCRAHSAGSFDFYLTPTDYYTIVVGVDNLGYGYWGTNGNPRGGKFTPLGSSASSGIAAIVRGFMPNHCLEFAFGDPKDIDDWYDLADVGSLELRLNAGSGGGTGTHAVVVQQLRKY